jgi:hypothetical protein
MARVISFMLAFALVVLPNSVELAPTTGDDSEKNPSTTHTVYRIYPNSSLQLDACLDIWKSASKLKLNFWKDPSRVGVPVDVMVPSTKHEQFEELLADRNLNYRVTIPDVQKLIEERERPRTRPSADPSSFDRKMMDDSSDSPFYDFQHYYPYEHMRLYMREIEKRFPDMAKVYTVGFTVENRPIEMIKIGFPLNKRGKKSVWIDAGIHAREWPSSTTALYFMQQLVSKYNSDPVITQYVNELNFYITPLLNPDGHEYSRSSTDPEIRLWRKNRSPNTGTCRRNKCCMGVDLNRNFDFHWGETGASTDPCEEIYQGSSAFSEPEARAVRDFIMSHKNDIQAVVTMHTYSQLWIHPYGHVKFSYPPDVDELHDTGMRAAAALEKVYGTKYKVGSGADTLYPASGGSDDWSKSKAGIKYVYLLELRPEDSVIDGFILDPRYILPTAKETWEGVKVVISQVLTHIGIPPVGTDAKPTAPFNRNRDV